MAALTLRVHYGAGPDESLWCLVRHPSADPDAARIEPVPMRSEPGGFWTVHFEGLAPGSLLAYRYERRNADGDVRREPCDRPFRVPAHDVTAWDHFLAPELPDGAFLRQAFAGIIFNPARTAAPPLEPAVTRRFRLALRAPRVGSGQRIGISGEHPLLGGWDPAKARPLSGANYPLWTLDLPADAFEGRMEFKFGLWDESAGRLVEFEAGPNRVFHGVPAHLDNLTVNYEHFEHRDSWRGAGVAIPVFSLRTKRGYGVGEFADLPPFAQWAAACRLHLVQLLPVNDTSSDFTWKDSYPYKAISTAALHPIYLSIDHLFRDNRVPLPADYPARRNALNRLPHVDYETVLRDKLDLSRALFDRVRTKALAHRDFRNYLREHARWIRPYAAFCHLRDLHGTADFSQWGDDARYPAAKVETWFHPDTPEYTSVMFHCWLQFHLDRQLTRALAAGHKLGIAFKGDLPIGIDRSSVEAWTEPELFQMDRQTGAPPDAFAVLGQNWGFPTYRWSRMQEDGYAWWRRRFHRMSTAFDALRIDHILGFFRIWEIPLPQKEGILGHYNPTRPLTPADIRAADITADPSTLAAGAVAEALLPELFGNYAPEVNAELLERGSDGLLRLRAAFVDPAGRQAWYARAGLTSCADTLEAGFARLAREVLFLEDPDQPGHFHPRINLADTARFLTLPEPEGQALKALHDDFYYRRHTQFWAAEAMKKLPVLMDASSMLICGEDLGNVPDSVPLVLGRLGLLSLEVQRWPKQLGRAFGTPGEYPYLSVCTTSTHDMSTVRGWWEEEPETRQRFYTEVMGGRGEAPADCSPELCRFIVAQNLAAGSMWCVLPLQDWLSIDGKLRHPVAADERINVPAIPRYYWRYRMHLTIESLRTARVFNRTVADLVESAGRR